MHHALHLSLIAKVTDQLSPQAAQFLTATKVVYNRRLRSSIGRAHLHQNLIELNPKILTRHPEEFEKTYAHELAHIVAPLIFGKHGLGWKKVMQDFGFPPERTHSLPIPRHKQRGVATAQCGCQGRIHEIKVRRYRKMRFGRRTYICLKCHEPLKNLKPV